MPKIEINGVLIHYRKAGQLGRYKGFQVLTQFFRAVVPPPVFRHKGSMVVLPLDKSRRGN